MNEQQVRTGAQLDDLIPGRPYYVTFQPPSGPKREMVALYMGVEGNTTKWDLRPTGNIQVLDRAHLIKISGPTDRRVMKPRRLGD
jgi:hypothetical protein